MSLPKKLDKFCFPTELNFQNIKFHLSVWYLWSLNAVFYQHSLFYENARDSIVLVGSFSEFVYCVSLYCGILWIRWLEYSIAVVSERMLRCFFIHLLSIPVFQLLLIPFGKVELRPLQSKMHALVFSLGHVWQQTLNRDLMKTVKNRESQMAITPWSETNLFCII